MKNWNIELKDLEYEIINPKEAIPKNNISFVLNNFKLISSKKIYCEVETLHSKDGIRNFEYYFCNNSYTGTQIKILPDGVYSVHLCFKASNKYYLILKSVAQKCAKSAPKVRQNIVK
jgi:hypothetical protein